MLEVVFGQLLDEVKLSWFISWAPASQLDSILLSGDPRPPPPPKKKESRIVP